MPTTASLRRWVLLAGCLLMVGGTAQAFEPEIRLLFGIRTAEIDATPLVADPGAAGYVDDERFFRALLSVRHDVGALRFFGQSRIVLDDSDGAVNGRKAKTDTDATLDELSLSYALDDTTILFLGRRNLSAGQSFGINPADVFLQESDLDRSLPAARRRSEIEGIDMAGAELFFADGSSLLAYFAPGIGNLNENAPHRAYALFRTSFGTNFADLALFAFEDTAPGAGFSIAYPFESGLILHSDTAFRKGRDLPQLREDGSIGERDAKRPTIAGTLGLGYVFGSGLAANLEYTHLSGGYDTSEWRRFGDAIAANTPPTNPAQGAALAALGRIAEADYLRRNYAFLRLYHPDILDTGFEAEWTALYGLDDGSGNLNLRFRRGLDDATTLSLSLGTALGEEDDEFRRGVERSSVGLFLERAL